MGNPSTNPVHHTHVTTSAEPCYEFVQFIGCVWPGGRDDATSNYFDATVGPTRPTASTFLHARGRSTRIFRTHGRLWPMPRRDGTQTIMTGGKAVASPGPMWMSLNGQTKMVERIGIADCPTRHGLVLGVPATPHVHCGSPELSRGHGNSANAKILTIRQQIGYDTLHMRSDVESCCF
jgi:hypothetical protein